MYNKIFAHDYAAALRHANVYFKKPQIVLAKETNRPPSVDEILDEWAETKNRWTTGNSILAGELINLYFRIGKMQIPRLSGSYFPGTKNKPKTEWKIRIDGFLSFEDFYNDVTGLTFAEETHNMISFFDYDDPTTIEFLPVLVFAYLFSSISNWSQLAGNRPNSYKVPSDAKNAEAMCAIRQNHDRDSSIDVIEPDVYWALYSSAASQFFERVRLPSLAMAKFRRTVHNGKAPQKQDITHMFYATLLFLKIICEFAQLKLDSKANCCDTSFEIAASMLIFNAQTGGLLDLYFDRRVIGWDDRGLIDRLYSEELQAQMQEEQYEKKLLLETIIKKCSYSGDGSTLKKEVSDSHFLPIVKSFYNRFSNILTILPKTQKMPKVKTPKGLADYMSCIDDVAQLLKSMLPFSEDTGTFEIESFFEHEATQLIDEWEGFVSDIEDGSQPLLLHYIHNFFVNYRDQFYSCQSYRSTCLLMNRAYYF